MIVQFVYAHTRKPAGIAFRLCPDHLLAQTTPDGLELRVQEGYDADPMACDECQPQNHANGGRNPAAPARGIEWEGKGEYST